MRIHYRDHGELPRRWFREWKPGRTFCGRTAVDLPDDTPDDAVVCRLCDSAWRATPHLDRAKLRCAATSVG